MSLSNKLFYSIEGALIAINLNFNQNQTTLKPTKRAYRMQQKNLILETGKQKSIIYAISLQALNISYSLLQDVTSVMPQFL